jgi:Bifunctional DNA primase/polymerase, N-terminal/AAA domain
MTNLPTPVSKCSPDEEPYDGLDLFVAECRAAEIIAAARGISYQELEDNFVRSRIDHAAYDVVGAAIVEIRNHPGYRPTDPDFWERVIKSVCKSVGAPALDAPIVEHAIYYARLGWHVFPCNPTDKRPLVSNGFYSATTDEDEIRAWWRRWPNAMIGVRMGATSGVWAIDPDAPKQGSPDGVANWAELVAKHGGIPHTHTHNTPNGGQHLLFNWRDDRPVTNSEGGLSGLGINVRGEGGYVVAPPSVMANGKAYEIAEPLHFFNFAEAPEWLYDLILPKPPALSPAEPAPSISQQALAIVRSPSVTRNAAYADAALRGEYDAVKSAPLGGRNNQLNNSAFKLGTLVGRGVLTEQAVETAMLEAAVACGLVADDGRDKCLATIRSGLSAGIRSPRDIPERHMENASETSEAQSTNAGATVVSIDSARKPTPPAPIGIPLTFFDDVENFVEKHWLMKGVIAKGETSMWIAPPGKLKSALMTDMAVHLASGMDWRGYQSKEVCGVVYFALERADLVKRRLAAHRKRDDLTGIPIAVAGGIINLMDPNCVGIIVTTILEAKKRFGCSVGFVVFDTYAKGIAAGGGDENQAKDQGRAIANLRLVQEQTGVHIAIISHTGKEEKRGARGSNAQDGDVDVMVQISGDGIKVATVTKANDQAEGVLTKFKAEVAVLGTDEDGVDITAAIISADACGSADTKSNEKAPLKPTERRAMDMLYNAVVEHGKDPPPSPEFPRKIKVVPIDTWRTYCKRGGLSDGDTEAAFRMAFKRVSISLANKHRIGMLDDLVWVAYDEPAKTA